MSSLQPIYNQLCWIKQRICFTLFPQSILEEPEPLQFHSPAPDAPKVGHIAMYTTGNAGDTLLPLTIRDSFSRETDINWKGIHAHRIVNQKTLNTIQQMNGLIIGGGGLFLCDTNPNRLSGWQWSCSLKKLEQIKLPIAVFAVGYNRFRGQEEFKPIFRDHLQLLAEKAVYIALRNSGSIEAIKSYLPTRLHSKVRYQPCPTTLLHTLYKPVLPTITNQRPIIALNAAFDRLQLRLGNSYKTILQNIASACKSLSTEYDIVYYAHTKEDCNMLPYLDQAGVPYRVIKLFHVPAKTVLEAYQVPHLVIGMRGHAQMIPFGCCTPILSLISHDKIRWFLHDIKRPQWGIEMNQPHLAEKIIDYARKILNNHTETKKEICSIQSELNSITTTNTKTFLKSL